MPDTHSERPQSSVLTADIRVDMKRLAKAMPIFLGGKTEEVIVRQHGDKIDNELFYTHETPLLSVPVIITNSWGETRSFTFEIKQLDLDVLDINFVLLSSCRHESESLHEFLRIETFGAAFGREFDDHEEHRYYVLVVEPTLHFEDTKPGTAVQAIAHVFDDKDKDFYFHLLGREALRQLLAVA